MLSIIFIRNKVVVSTKSINQKDDEVEENMILAREAFDNMDEVGSNNGEDDDPLVVA